MSDRRFHPHRAERLEAPDRARWQPPAEILDRLDPRPGEVVADVGAGTGYFSFPLAERVGADGRVVAFEVQSEMLARLMARRATAVAAAAVHPVQAVAEALPAADGAFDRVLLANVWHELDDAAGAAAEALRALRPGGRLAVVDRRPDVEVPCGHGVEHPPGPPLEHRVAAGEVVRTLESAGWAVEPVSSAGPYHYLVMARPRESVAAYWAEFLRRTGRPADTPRYDAFHFGDREDSARALAGLVLAGRKVATSGLHREYVEEDRRIPAPGDLSVVTDWEGRPLCVIETVAAEVRAFVDVDAGHAAAEGEGDGTLDGWRRGHRAFFERHAAEAGWEFSPRTAVVCERFRVVFPEPAGGA